MPTGGEWRSSFQSDGAGSSPALSMGRHAPDGASRPSPGRARHPRPARGRRSTAYRRTDLADGRQFVADALKRLPTLPNGSRAWRDRSSFRLRRGPARPAPADRTLSEDELNRSPSRRRLAYDELPRLQLALALMRSRVGDYNGEYGDGRIVTLRRALPVRAHAVASARSPMSRPQPPTAHVPPAPRRRLRRRQISSWRSQRGRRAVRP